MRESVRAILQPKARDFELAEGVSVKVKELSLRERIEWRAASVKEDGSLSDDWVPQLLFRAVQDIDGFPLWESVESVDGAEGILGKLLEAVQETNGLAAGSSKEAQGN